MSRKSKAPDQTLPRIDSEVVRQIRQHARSENKAEVCGVLIGRETADGIDISACIAGVNAAQGGAHVTFTQDTWEHIYKVKDKDFPDERILGWYHSHPGFGIFLSDHDTFIHKNFFSSPRQIAWVYDPHSDEEGCFGWQGGRIVRLTRIDVIDRHGGEGADSTHILATRGQESSAQPNHAGNARSINRAPHDRDAENDTSDEDDSLERLASVILSHLAVLALGFALSYFLFPKILVMAVPVDPQTGAQIGPMVEVPMKNSTEPLKVPRSADDKAKNPGSNAASPAKEGDAQRR
jgi:proteasome lid subunit RPN8/RPN11